jgi:hypothetical protein
LLIVAVHADVDYGWLLEGGYPNVRWIGRVLGRAFLTLGIAIISTLSFEVVGGFLSLKFRDVTNWIQNRISYLLIRYLHWGMIDEQGEPVRNDDDDFIWAQNLRRENVRRALHGLAIVIFEYNVTFLLKLFNQLVEMFVRHVLSPVLHFFLSIPEDFVASLPSWLALPTPGLDKVRKPREVWFEYGVPIVIQFILLVILWLLKFLYQAQTLRWAMRGWRVEDTKIKIIWNLIRATAMHLIAYTAYQLACATIVVLKSLLPQETWYITLIDGPVVPFLNKLIPEGSIFAAALILCFHWLLRAASVLFVPMARPLWMPYLLWQTRLSVGGAGQYWPLFIESLKDDISVLDPTKRVISRVVMTAIFGLKSSWPARFHLSDVVDDN